MYDPSHSPPPIPIPERPRTLPDHAAAKLDFAPEPGLTAEVVAAIRANYGGKVSFVDDWCRRIFDAYAARGWLDGLLVIITSDDGEMAGDHGRVYKRTFHESAFAGAAHPALARRIPHGTRDALVENIDVLPTVLAAIGVPQPPMSLGRSLLPVIFEPGGAVPHRPVGRDLLRRLTQHDAQDRAPQVRHRPGGTRRHAV